MTQAVLHLDGAAHDSTTTSGAHQSTPAAPREQGRYAVGGVLLERPYAIRRLGHFGFNVRDLDAELAFYTDTLGFMVSDSVDFRDKAPDPARLDGVGTTRGYFLRHGTEHHSFVLFPEAAYRRLSSGSPFGAEASINQITFQVGSLEEVIAALSFLKERGVVVRRAGRDVPGSNWHSYFYDPDGHVVELFYGIEQIGWNGESKPKAAHLREYHAAPSLPQMPEHEEIAAARQSDPLTAGYRYRETLPARFSVGGIRMSRPFKIVRVGPVRLFVDDLDRARTYYEKLLGLEVTEEARWRNHTFLLLRNNTEHHTVALYPKALRSQLPVRQDDSCLSFGVQVANYAQLRDARQWLSERSVSQVELPPELSPGIDRSVFARSPGGHLIQLYWYMEQVTARGVGGAHQRDYSSASTWPEAVAAPADAFRGETLLGPWA